MAKTPEGAAKEAIVRANGDMPIEQLCIYKNFTGSMPSDTGRRYRAGLTKRGSSDLITVYSLKITPAMVGKTIGVIGAFEVKPPGSGEETSDQALFGANIRNRGGIYAVVRRPQDVKEAICRWLLQLIHE